MATKTEEFLTGTGTTIGFTTQYINESDIKVRVDGGNPLTFIGTTGTPTTGQYKIAANSTTITFGDNQNGKSLHIYSETDVSTPTVNFTPGSSIKAADLNSIETLIRHGIKESRNEIVTNRIRNGQVTSDKILDGTIVNADINASAAIDNSKIADGLLKSGITVNSANIVNQSIVNDDISNSANINGSKLLNDSVTLDKLGSGTLPNDIVVTRDNIENGTIQDADIETGTLDNRYYTETELNNGQLNNLYYTETELNNGQLDNRYFTETELLGGAVDARYYTEDELNGGQLNSLYFTESELTGGAIDGRYYTETELDAGQLDNRYYTETELNAGQLDNRYYTETESEALFLRQDSSETIASGVAWSGTDSKVATTAAIDARIIDLLDDVGGFVPLANETSFPTANPDINNGNGTVVSVKAVSTNLTPSSGTVTIANGAGTGNTVTITGVTGVIPQGFGMILETTSTLHTYAFHRLQAKATEVNTVATNIGNVIACGQNLTDIENFADLYQISTTAPTTRADGTALTVGDLWFDSSANQVMMVYDGSAGDGFSAITPNASTISAINTVAGHITYSEDLGLITEAVNTGSGNNSINTVGASIANVNTVAADLNETTSEIDTVATNIANVNNVGNDIANVNAVAGNATNINAVKNNATNINTVAGINANVTTVAGISSDVTAVAGNATNINAVEDNETNINAVAGNNTNITAVANNATNINAVKNNETNINAVKNNATNINAVNANKTNIDTVAANNSNVTTVAGKATEIGRLGTADAVADMNLLATTAVVSDLNDCADIKANISTVAGIASNVTTVAGNNSNVTAVAGNNSNITAVANNATNINAVQANASNINAAVSNASNINAVVSNATNINTTANNISDVNNFVDRYQISASAPTQRTDGSSLRNGDLWFNDTTEAMEAYDGSTGDGFTPIQPSATVIQNIANVTGFVTFTEDNGLITDAINTGSGNNSINTVGSNIANVNTVSGSIANVNNVGNNISNVNAVHNNRTNINAAVSNASNINAAVSNASNINAAVSNAANITTVAGNNSNVTTVANSIADVNRYAQEYIIANSSPGSPSAGDLWYNSSGNTLNYYTGGAWVGIAPGIASLLNDPSPELSAALDCNNKNLTEVATVSGDNLQIDFGTLS